MAGDVLGSARVRPTRLLESGFTFAFPDIEEAIRAA
jgi:NAD dependent epimerase/dehydratase family enzyme